MFRVYDSYNVPYLDPYFDCESLVEAFEECENLTTAYSPQEKSLIRWEWQINLKTLYGWVDGHKDAATGEIIPLFIIEEL